MNSKDTIIHAGWLINGSGGPASKDVLIKLSDRIISSIADYTPGHDEYLDFTDCTIIPALCDSHTHLAISGRLDPEIRDNQLHYGYDQAEAMITGHVRNYLKHGVLYVRDGGDFHAHTLRFKNLHHGKKGNNLSIYAAGNGIHVKGRYGQLLGMHLTPGRELAQAIFEDFRPGMDHVKIVNSGVNSLTEFGKETSPQFSVDELKGAVRAAESIGLKVMVHANGKEPVRMVVESGCHTVEHGFFMDADNLKRMADKGTIWVPTICTMKAYMDNSAPESGVHHVAKKNLTHQLEQVEMAIRYGVTIALGTDAGSPGVYHGSGVIEELGLLLKAGLSIEEAIKCATSNAMQLISDAPNTGTLSNGNQATFVAIKGKPADLPDSLKKIREIWVNGKRI
ncbi:MAG: amidohydrolase family protein [Deltaproteobacteria bacterium]|nr:amidohydrolase family protein [Deltaproteobacteria bacterium]